MSMTKTPYKMSNKKTIVRVSLDLPKALRNRVDEAAAAEGQDFASAARVALREWADRILTEEDTLLSS